MLSRYLKYLEVERNYSAQTIRAYGDDLRQFFACCGIEGEFTTPPTIGARTVRAWLSSLLAQGHAPSTAHRKLSALRGFYRFLSRQGILTQDPLRGVVAPKRAKRLPFFLEPPEANRLLDAVEYPGDFAGQRDRLVILLFYFLGLRVSELAHLHLPQVDLANRVIRVVGKGRKERIIPIHPELLAALRAYLDTRAERYPQAGTTHLILSNRGEPPYPGLLYRIARGYMAQVTPLEQKSPHVLRHTFATHLLNQGADINAIKELLGHANLSATQVYTHTSIKRLKTAYRKAHPRA